MGINSTLSSKNFLYENDVMYYRNYITLEHSNIFNFTSELKGVLYVDFCMQTHGSQRKTRMNKEKNYNYIHIFLFIFFLVSGIIEVKAQIIIDEPPRQLYYDRLGRVKKFKDMRDMRDVFHYDKFLLGRNRISGNVSYNTGRVLIDDANFNKHSEIRSAMAYFIRYRFLEQFSVNATFYQDFNKRVNARWISDFNYSIGRYAWQNMKLNFGYENYCPNKYNDNISTLAEKFLEGYYFVSYNRNLSEKATAKIKLDDNTMVRFVAFARCAIRYADEFNTVVKR